MWQRHTAEFWRSLPWRLEIASFVEYGTNSVSAIGRKRLMVYDEAFPPDFFSPVALLNLSPCAAAVYFAFDNFKRLTAGKK